MMGQQSQGVDCSEFVEVDPTGRYGRYSEILGKGSSKIVYKAFDEYEGIEVAWNQVKLYDFLQSPEELERLYCEIHLLKTIKHKNIMKFYTSWVDISNRNINFVTEMFTSGTLRQYRQKHKKVNIRAVKHWCRQILEGLLYLHSHDPPIIHRDLKCDNIFINGNQGEVKIGDLGLAAILRKSHVAHCVGTPEFMAPEIYEEQYNELVDVYSFGMCILEMVTFDYPYSECTHPAQIYKKVISELKPDALYKVEDPEVRQFIEKCLATVSQRLPAKELLNDPFLQIDDLDLCTREDDNSELESLARKLSLSPSNSNHHLFGGWSSNDLQCDVENEWEYDIIENELHGIDLFSSSEDETVPDVDVTIKGRRREDGQIFLRLRITDKQGRVRNIHFSFDVEADTALSVATEMVGELDITDYDVTSIAEMIDDEILSLVPDWNPGPGIEESVGFPTPHRYINCELNSSSCTSQNDHHLVRTPSQNHLSSHCLRSGIAHGRFEEVTYKVDGSQTCASTTEGALELSSQGNEPNLGSKLGKENENRDDRKLFYHYRSSSVSTVNGTKTESLRTNSFSRDGRKSFSHHRSKSISANHFNPSIGDSSIYDQSLANIGVGYQHPPPDLPKDYENEIKKELRCLREKNQMESTDHERQRFEETRKPSSPLNDEKEIENGVSQSPLLSPRHSSNSEFLKSIHFGMWLSSNLPYDKRDPTISAAKATISAMGSAEIATFARQ